MQNIKQPFRTVDLHPIDAAPALRTTAAERPPRDQLAGILHAMLRAQGGDAHQAGQAADSILAAIDDEVFDTVGLRGTLAEELLVDLPAEGWAALEAHAERYGSIKELRLSPMLAIGLDDRQPELTKRLLALPNLERLVLVNPHTGLINVRGLGEGLDDPLEIVFECDDASAGPWTVHASHGELTASDAARQSAASKFVFFENDEVRAEIRFDGRIIDSPLSQRVLEEARSDAAQRILQAMHLHASDPRCPGAASAAHAIVRCLDDGCVDLRPLSAGEADLAGSVSPEGWAALDELSHQLWDRGIHAAVLPVPASGSWAEASLEGVMQRLANLPSLRDIVIHGRPAGRIDLSPLEDRSGGVGGVNVLLRGDTRPSAWDVDAPPGLKVRLDLPDGAGPDDAPRVPNGVVHQRRPSIGKTAEEALAIDLNGRQGLWCGALAPLWLQRRAAHRALPAAERPRFAYGQAMSPEAIRTASIDRDEMNAQYRQAPTALFDVDRFGDLLAQEAGELGRGDIRQFLIASGNHVMALELELELEGTSQGYKVSFFDPNQTGTHMRMTAASADQLRGRSLCAWLSGDEMHAYFGHPQDGRIAALYAVPARPTPANVSEMARHVDGEAPRTPVLLERLMLADHEQPGKWQKYFDDILSECGQLHAKGELGDDEVQARLELQFGSMEAWGQIYSDKGAQLLRRYMRFVLDGKFAPDAKWEMLGLRSGLDVLIKQSNKFVIQAYVSEIAATPAHLLPPDHVRALLELNGGSNHASFLHELAANGIDRLGPAVKRNITAYVRSIVESPVLSLQDKKWHCGIGRGGGFRSPVQMALQAGHRDVAAAIIWGMNLTTVDRQVRDSMLVASGTDVAAIAAESELGLWAVDWLLENGRSQEAARVVARRGDFLAESLARLSEGVDPRNVVADLVRELGAMSDSWQYRSQLSAEAMASTLQWVLSAPLPPELKFRLLHDPDGLASAVLNGRAHRVRTHVTAILGATPEQLPPAQRDELLALRDPASGRPLLHHLATTGFTGETVDARRGVAAFVEAVLASRLPLEDKARLCGATHPGQPRSAAQVAMEAGHPHVAAELAIPAVNQAAHREKVPSATGLDSQEKDAYFRMLGIDYETLKEALRAHNRASGIVAPNA